MQIAMTIMMMMIDKKKIGDDAERGNATRRLSGQLSAVWRIGGGIAVLVVYRRYSAKSDLDDIATMISSLR